MPRVGNIVLTDAAAAYLDEAGGPRGKGAFVSALIERHAEYHAGLQTLEAWRVPGGEWDGPIEAVAAIVRALAGSESRQVMLARLTELMKPNTDGLRTKIGRRHVRQFWAVIRAINMGDRKVKAFWGVE